MNELAQAASPTLLWWHLLCVTAGLNLAVWTASTAWLHRHRPEGSTWPHQRLQCLLSALYVLGCGYRSVLPVFDVPRMVMVDSWASSVLIGRTVATIAELSFAAQWALLLHGAGVSSGHRPSLWVSWAVLPMIGAAELASWYAVLTTHNLGHVIEEGLWGTAAVCSVAALAGLWRLAPPRGRRWLGAVILLGSAYAAYMFSVDVPMYWSRWQADTALARSHPSLLAGLSDVAQRWTVTHDWAHWRSEVVWMTLYFSVAVWVSIGLAHVRLPLGQPRAGRP